MPLPTPFRSPAVSSPVAHPSAPKMSPPLVQNPSRLGAAAILDTGEMDSALPPPVQGHCASPNSSTQVQAAQAAFAAQSRAAVEANAGPPGSGAQLPAVGAGAGDHELEPIVQKQPRTRRNKRIDDITLVDIAQCFHLPIREASKTLKIGVTILKQKCRKYGIPRWPHRKIKSLDSLIQDLEYVLEDLSKEDAQEELMPVEDQEQAAAVIEDLSKRKRMLEREKETIQQKPTLDLMTETKQFRQGVFKKRYRAKNEIM